MTRRNQELSLIVGTILTATLLYCPAPYAVAGVLDVHFMAASAVLPDQDRQAIADLAHRSSDLPRIEFSVHGYTDQGTLDRPNMTEFGLSQARLDAMAQILTQHGVRLDDMGRSSSNYAMSSAEQVSPDGLPLRKAGTIVARTRTDCHPLETTPATGF